MSALSPLVHLLALVRNRSGLFVIVLGLLWLPVIWFLQRNPLSPNAKRRWMIAGGVAGLLLIALFELGIAKYASSNALSDHVESNVISLSGVWGTQHPLYAPLESAERYSLLYGPDLFILNRISMDLFGQSIATAKLPEALLAGLTLPLLFFLFRRESSTAIALFCTVYCVLAIEMFAGQWDTCPFWARGEPYIIFCTVLALIAARIKSRTLGIILLGVALGFTVNVKLHSVIFLFPAATLFTQKRGFVSLIVALAIAGVIGAIPFALPGISLRNYFVWLHVAGAHPLVRGMIRGYVATAFVGCLPVAALYAVERMREPTDSKVHIRDHLPFCIACAVAFCINIVPSLKLGSGVYHYLPFVPLLGFVLCKLLTDLLPRWTALSSADLPLVALASAAMLVMTAKLLVDEHEQNQFDRENGAWANAVIDEIKGIERDNPGKTIAMGYGSTLGYIKNPLSDYRTQMVFDHQPYPLDATSVMDTQLAGKPIATATLDDLKSGRVGIWLIPRGDDPFSMVRVNEPESSPKIFDKPFRSSFFENYQMAGQTANFDLWEFKG